MIELSLATNKFNYFLNESINSDLPSLSPPSTWSTVRGCVLKSDIGRQGRSFQIPVEHCKAANSRAAVHAACLFLVALLAYPEDGGSIFIRSVAELLPDCAVSHPGR
jgi:hypothetical protein